MEKTTMPSHDHKQKFVGAVNFTINKFASLGSTNLFLKTHLDKYPNFAVITTENQTSGRGRFDRSWRSKTGRSLTFSAKIPLHSLPQQNWSNTTQVMAVSVALLLEEHGLKPQIKWPNDILVCGEKICGILAEAISSDLNFSMILGVGLNINEDKNDFFGLDRAATSLLIQTGKVFRLDEILQRLLEIFADLFERFVHSGFREIAAMVSQRLYKPRDAVRIIQGTNAFEGIMSGITEQGAVLIETDSGTIEVVSGEITSRTGLPE